MLLYNTRGERGCYNKTQEGREAITAKHKRKEVVTVKHKRGEREAIKVQHKMTMIGSHSVSLQLFHSAYSTHECMIYVPFDFRVWSGEP